MPRKKKKVTEPSATSTNEEKVPTLHHPEGVNKSDWFFDEELVSRLTLEFQKTKSVETWHEIVLATLPLIDTIILNYGFQQYDELDSLRSECVIKLRKLLDVFDPTKGRCFSHFSVSFKHYLISFAHKVKNKAKLVTTVEDEILDKVEAAAYIPYEISDEFKKRVQDIETRFSDKDTGQVEAQKYLLNYFLLEGFNSSKTKLCHTLVASYRLTQDQAYLLYDYVLLKMRSVLMDFYNPPYNDIEILRISRRWSLLPDLVEIIGIDAFKKLATLMGGITITFPTQKDLARLRTEKLIMEQGNIDPSYTNLHKYGTTNSGIGEGSSCFRRIGEAMLEGKHETRPLYEEEMKMKEDFEHEQEEDKFGY